jgi:hypothetical protein
MVNELKFCIINLKSKVLILIKTNKMKNIKLLVLLLIGLTFKTSYGQESLVSAGNSNTGSNGSISYSVGQIFYTTNIGTNGYLIQGVQQPFEISVISSDNTLNIDLLFSVYPNPTTDFLILKFEHQDNVNANYQLYNINGSLIKTGKISIGETKIEVVDLSNSIYILKVMLNGKSVKTFKIIKN